MIEILPDEWEPVSTPLKIEKADKHHGLTDEIVKYVFANLGISEPRKVSIQHDMFKTNKTISFIEDGVKQTMPIFACQTEIHDKKFEITSLKLNNNEAIVLVRLEGCPMYGAYLSDECMVGVWVKEHWIKGSMFIQASFLAGMEQMKTIGKPFDGMTDLGDMFDAMKKFLEFVND
jgi:hypothetical protein